MANTVSGENAGSPEKSGEVKAMSPDEYLKWRVGDGSEVARAAKLNPDTKPKEGKEADEPEAKAEDKPTEPPAEGEKEVLSQSHHEDHDDLTEEEKAILEKARSKLLPRIGELTAKYRAAEAEANKLKQLKVQERSAMEQELLPDNPYAGIADAKAYVDKMRETKEIIEFAEARLDEAMDIGPDDVAATVEGKNYTKRELRELRRKAVKARDEFLPDAWKRIQIKAESARMGAALQEQVRKQLPWVADDKDERNQRLKAILTDPKMIKLKDFDPVLAEQMPFWMSHAVNNLYQRKEIKLESAAEKIVAKEDPPENASRGASSAGRSREIGGAQEREATERLQRTGSKEDWVKRRELQLTKRKTKKL